jgi:hypothetical protein
MLARNAAGAVGYYCNDCRRWVSKEKGHPGQWIAKDHPELAGKDLRLLPAVGERIYRKCEGPWGITALCELHHTAPRKLFGDDCERWTVVYLCRACHERWHSIATPGLCTEHDAHAHAAQLIDVLGLDRAALLTRSLIRLGRSLRPGA